MKYLWINFLFISLVMTTSCVSRVKSISSELVYEAKAVTGEGSIWHPSRHTLFWVDIEGQTLYEYHPADKTCSSWRFDRMISTVVPETDTTVVVALQDEIVRVHLSDGHTALWVGTMGFGAPKEAGTLYCVLPDGEVLPKLRKVTISNGIVWTSDKQYMYYNDTPTGRIARYRYDAASGEISFDGIAVVLPEGSGSPDGMTIDGNDNLWVAQWGGSGVYCYNPRTGELLAKVEVPAPHVASCAFGGEKLDTLYITTARAGLTDEQLKQYPLSGSLFSCRPGVQGVPANGFGKP